MCGKSADSARAECHDDLTLRSHAQRGVSKGGQPALSCPPFETRPAGPLLRVRSSCRPAVDTFATNLRVLVRPAWAYRHDTVADNAERSVTIDRERLIRLLRMTE